MLPQSTTPVSDEDWATYQTEQADWHASEDPFQGIFKFLVTKRQRVSLSRFKTLLFERDGLDCSLCQRPLDVLAVHIDHILPISWQGSNAFHNLQLAHPDCNLLKQSTLHYSLIGAFEVASLRLWSRHASLSQPDLQYGDLAKSIKRMFRWFRRKGYPPDVCWIVLGALAMQVQLFETDPGSLAPPAVRLSRLADSPHNFMVRYYALEKELADYTRLLF